jgi:hypothetical protein
MEVAHLLNIWFGRCKFAVRRPKDTFSLIYYREWFDDPFVQEMILDVDKTKVINYQSSIDYLGQPMDTLKISGGVKSLILMYKIPNLLISGNSMGDNCAKWILEIGKRQDCYMTLSYGMRFTDDIVSKEEMICKVMNTGQIIKTFRDFYFAYYSFPRDENDRLPELLELPYPLIREDEIL